MTPSDTLAELARCSFCGKLNTEVDKLVAGAGANICNECVALSALVIDESPNSHAVPRVPVWESLTDEEMLGHIPRVAMHIDQAEADLRAWVRELRRRGVTWARIGEALGISRQTPAAQTASLFEVEAVEAEQPQSLRSQTARRSSVRGSSVRGART